MSRDDHRASGTGKQCQEVGGGEGTSTAWSDWRRLLEEGGSFQIFIWVCQDLVEALGIFSFCMWNLVPWPRVELWPCALRAWSLSHWTTREVPLRNV